MRSSGAHRARQSGDCRSIVSCASILSQTVVTVCCNYLQIRLSLSVVMLKYQLFEIVLLWCVCLMGYCDWWECVEDEDTFVL